MKRHLCVNCLEDDASPVPIGHDQGLQRDPYRAQIDLCQSCTASLMNGEIDIFNARYSATRLVTRDGS